MVPQPHKALAFLDPVRRILEPTSIGLFAGKMDYSKIDPFDRSIADAVSSSEGDWRNWEAIDEWARKLQASFVSESHPRPRQKP